MRINEVYAPVGSIDRSNLVLVRDISGGYAYLSKVDRQSSTEDCTLFDSQSFLKVPVKVFKKQYTLCGRTRAAYKGSASSCLYVLNASTSKPYMEELIEADRQWYFAMRAALSWSGRDRAIFQKSAAYADELDDRINENCKRAHISRQ